VLPPDRLAAIERLGFGRYEKMALRFGEPFWRVAGLPHMMIFPRNPGDPAVWRRRGSTGSLDMASPDLGLAAMGER
jgi:hypothetical protein